MSSKNNVKDLNIAINNMVKNIDSTIQTSSKIWLQYAEQITSSQQIISKVTQETNNLTQTLATLQANTQADLNTRTASNDAINATGKIASESAVGVAILNSVMEAGMGMLIQFLANGIFTAIDNYLHRSERIQEAAEAARDKIDELKSSFQTLSSSVSGVKNQYAELAQGVDQITGKNLTLSAEDYENFLSLGNQLADLFPSLTSHFDENGNSILNLTGDIDGIVGSLNDFVAVQQKIATKEMLDELPDIHEGYIDKANKYSKTTDDLERKKKAVEQIPDTYSITPNTYDNNQTDIILTFEGDEEINFEDVVEEFKESFSQKGTPLPLVSHDFDIDTGKFVIKVQDVTNEQIAAFDNLDNTINEHLEKINDDISYNNHIMEGETAKYNEYLSIWLADNDLYTNQSSDIQSAIQQQLFQSDWTALAKADNVNIENSEETYKWLEQKYLKGIDSLSDAEKLKFSELFNTDISAEEKVKLANELSSVFAENNIKIPFDFITDEQKSGSTQDTINKFNERNYGKENGFKSGDVDGLTEFFKNYSIDSEAEYKEWLKITEGIDSATMAMAEYKAQKAKDKKELTNIEKIASVHNLSTGLTPLANIYADVANGGDFDWSSILNNEAFINTFQSMGSSYTDFIETIANSPNDIASCQSAFDNLVTSYINSSGILDNVTEDTKAATIAQLEQMGVSNALSIVEDTLAAKAECLALQNQFASEQGYELANAELSEAIGFLNSTNASDLARQALAQYVLQKIAANANTINTSDDIDNVIALANAAGASAVAISKLESAKSILSQSNSSIAPPQWVVDNAKETISQIENGTFDYGINVIDSAKFKVPSRNTSSSPTDTAAQTKTETTQTFNFIETAVKRIESALDQVKSKAENTFLSLKSRADSYKKALETVTQEINLQNEAKNKYEERANSVGLEEEWKVKVQNGDVSIEDVKDDGLKQRIQNYQTWYEKSQECLKKIEELENNLTQLKINKLQLSIDEAGFSLKTLGNSYDKIKYKMSLKEKFGFSASKSDYTDLNSNLVSQMKNMVKQNNLVKQQQANVEKGSEAWKKYQEQIDSNKQSIQSLTISMIENAEAAANLANQAAKNKNEKIDKNSAITEQKLGLAATAKKKNNLLNTQIKDTNKKYTNLNTAYSNSQASVNSTSKKAGKLKKDKLSKGNLIHFESVQKQVKSKKKVSAGTLSKIEKAMESASGGELSQLTNLYKYSVNWNKRLEARTEAKYNLQLYAIQAEAEKADLREQKLQNTLAANQSTYELKSTRTGTTAAEKNQTLSSSITQIQDNRTAYANNTTKATENREKVGTTASSGLSVKKNAAQKYKDAVKKAKDLIKAGKKIDGTTLATLKEYCKLYLNGNYTLHTNCTKYNSALDAQITAEQAEVLYNAQSYGEEYAAERAKTQNTVDERNAKNELYEATKTNATTANSKNSLIKSQISNLDLNLTTYKTDWGNATTALNTTANTVTNTATKGMSTAQLDIMNSIKNNYVSKRLTIPDTWLTKAGQVSNAYQMACYNYNAALASAEAAKQTYEMYEQTSKTEKANFAVESVGNVQAEYESKLNTNQTKSNNYQAQLDKQSASGVSQSKSQYNEQIKQSKERQDILEKEKKALLETLKAQKDAGNITEDHPEYIRLQNDISALDAEIITCVTDQISFNTAIAEMDLSNFKALISLLNVLDSKLSGLTSLAEAHGNKVSDSILKQQMESAQTNLELFQQSLKANEDLIRNYAGVGGKWELNLDSEQLSQFISLLESGDVNAVDQFLKQIGSSYGQLTGLQDIMSDIASDYSSIYDSMVKQEQIYDTLLQNRISILNDVLDALNKINDQKERANALDKAKYNLERARNQRTNQVLTQNGIVYQANLQDVKSAEEELSNAEFTELTNTIQDAIDAIDELIKTNNVYDDDGNLSQSMLDIFKIVENVDSTFLKAIEQILAANGYHITDVKGFNTENWVSNDDDFVRISDTDSTQTLTPPTTVSNDFHSANYQTPNYSTASQNANPPTTLQFYGDLSFPNVKDGNDVETFVNELMNLPTYNMQYLNKK